MLLENNRGNTWDKGETVSGLVRNRSPMEGFLRLVVDVQKSDLGQVKSRLESCGEIGAPH